MVKDSHPTPFSFMSKIEERTPFHLAQPAEAGRSEVTAVKVTKAVCVEDER